MGESYCPKNHQVSLQTRGVWLGFFRWVFFDLQTTSFEIPWFLRVGISQYIVRKTQDGFVFKVRVVQFLWWYLVASFNSNNLAMKWEDGKRMNTYKWFALNGTCVDAHLSAKHLMGINIYAVPVFRRAAENCEFKLTFCRNEICRSACDATWDFWLNASCFLSFLTLLGGSWYFVTS